MPLTSRPAFRSIARIALLAIAFRCFSALIAFLANVVFPDYQQQFPSVFGSGRAFWDAMVRFDAGWYYQIARNGYEYTPGGRSTIAFFPAYPLLMRHVGRLFGRTPGDLYIGGLVVSWTAFTLAMIGLRALARLDLSARRADRAVLLAAVFPFAFFFGAVYTEALFLAATVWSVYGFRTRRWISGGLCGALATATRVNGILMLPALAWIVWRQLRTTGEAAHAERTSGSDRWRAGLGLLLVPAGIGLYSLYIWRLTGNPLEWAATIQRWGYYPGGEPWLALARLAGALLTHPYTFLAGERMAPYDTLNGVAALCAVAAVPWIWRRYGAAYGLFMIANLWLPLSSGQYEGMGRYCAVLFPLFILAAGAPRRLFTTTLVLSAMLYTLCMALFANTHPLF